MVYVHALHTCRNEVRSRRFHQPLLKSSRHGTTLKPIWKEFILMRHRCTAYKCADELDSLLEATAQALATSIASLAPRFSTETQMYEKYPQFTPRELMEPFAITLTGVDWHMSVKQRDAFEAGWRRNVFRLPILKLWYDRYTKPVDTTQSQDV